MYIYVYQYYMIFGRRLNLPWESNSSNGWGSTGRGHVEKKNCVVFFSGGAARQEEEEEEEEEAC